MTPAQRHQQRVLAELAAASRQPEQSMAGATAYELQLAELNQDKLRLKQVQSNEAKAQLKAQLLPKYNAYVSGVLTGGNGARDDVLTTIMVWRLDAGDYPGALNIAGYVLQHRMPTPDRFARDAATLIAEELAEAANKAHSSHQAFDLQLLRIAATLTADHDMPDEVRAKLQLALARTALASVDSKADSLTPAELATLQSAIEHYQRALQLNTRCGGKKELEQAQRLLNKHASPAG